MVELAKGRKGKKKRMQVEAWGEEGEKTKLM